MTSGGSGQGSLGAGGAVSPKAVVGPSRLPRTGTGTRARPCGRTPRATGSGGWRAVANGAHAMRSHGGGCPPGSPRVGLGGQPGPPARVRRWPTPAASSPPAASAVVRGGAAAPEVWFCHLAASDGSSREARTARRAGLPAAPQANARTSCARAFALIPAAACARPAPPRCLGARAAAAAPGPTPGGPCRGPAQGCRGKRSDRRPPARRPR